MRKRAWSLLLSLSLLVTGIIGVDGKKAGAAATLAGLNYSFSSLSADTETVGNTTDYTLKKTKYGSKKEGYQFTSGSAKLYASIDGSSRRKLEWSTDTYDHAGKKVRQPVMTAGKKNPWKSGTKPYFEIQISTSGYQDISFSAYIGATKKGPKNYQAAYAVGNQTTYTNISGASLSLSDNKKMQKISADLPEAAADQSLVKIRIFVSSLTAVNGNSLTKESTGGEAAINHILVAGTKKSTSYQVTKVSLNKTKLSLKKGKSYALKASVKVSPDTKAGRTAAKKKLTWSSSSQGIATVSNTGKVTAKKKGTVTITVKYSNTKSAKCKLTVK